MTYPEIQNGKPEESPETIATDPIDIWNDPEMQLAHDYCWGAEGFLSAAEIVCRSTDTNSVEWLFTLESPVTFLIAHAAELTLKGALAYSKKLEPLRHSHDLKRLTENVQDAGVPLDPNFLLFIDTIADSFDVFAHRYPRHFAGFPDDKADELNALIGKRDLQSRKTLFKYGLVSRASPAPLPSIDLVNKQLAAIVEWGRNYNGEKI